MQKEADFYGAMDGASKFVRGDAIAGILITLINVLGGFAIGIVQKGMPSERWWRTRVQIHILSSLSRRRPPIGDGLVVRRPAGRRLGRRLTIGDSRSERRSNLGELVQLSD